jgi:hypothetical protein
MAAMQWLMDTAGRKGKKAKRVVPDNEPCASGCAAASPPPHSGKGKLASSA